MLFLRFVLYHTIILCWLSMGNIFLRISFTYFLSLYVGEISLLVHSLWGDSSGFLVLQTIPSVPSSSYSCLHPNCHLQKIFVCLCLTVRALFKPRWRSVTWELLSGGDAECHTFRWEAEEKLVREFSDVGEFLKSKKIHINVCEEKATWQFDRRMNESRIYGKRETDRD